MSWKVGKGNVESVRLTFDDSPRTTPIKQYIPLGIVKIALINL
jgi:hypothetical protein